MERIGMSNFRHRERALEMVLRLGYRMCLSGILEVHMSLCTETSTAGRGSRCIRIINKKLEAGAQLPNNALIIWKLEI